MGYYGDLLNMRQMIQNNVAAWVDLGGGFRGLQKMMVRVQFKMQCY